MRQKCASDPWPELLCLHKTRLHLQFPDCPEDEKRGFLGSKRINVDEETRQKQGMKVEQKIIITAAATIFLFFHFPLLRSVSSLQKEKWLMLFPEKGE